ncbi:VWD domain-containing protein [Henriciella litoralis]|uniref:VWD domain-containing protein n=1 Tax=Henriciella litoralis TaxID=568102 RepID=UPI0009FBFC81|nr:VWD domain-containing protein [Henriciella litoralis]
MSARSTLRVAVLAFGLALFLALPGAQARQSVDSVSAPHSDWDDPITNQFGSMNSRCRGACGSDCPDTCDYREKYVCVSPMMIQVTKLYQCGTHDGCRIHDDCLDRCFDKYDPGILGAAGEKVDFLVGACQRKCHAEAYDFAGEVLQKTPEGRKNMASGLYTPWDLVWDWADGHGVTDGKMTFAYTRNEKNGQDFLMGCPACTICHDGQCAPDPDNPDCTSVNVFGDPHMVTPDGLAFDFHATGDYILLQSGNAAFQLIGRFEPASDHLTFASAFAIQSSFGPIEVYFGDHLDILVAGKSAQSGQDNLPDGAEITIEPDRLILTEPGIGRVVVSRTRRALQMGFEPADGAALRGLLGQVDGDISNDLPHLGDAPWEAPIVLDDFYAPLIEAWKAGSADGKSVFSREGLTASAPAALRRLEDFRFQALDLARNICDRMKVSDFAHLACLLDVAATGDGDYAAGAVRAAPVKESIRVIEAPDSETGEDEARDRGRALAMTYPEMTPEPVETPHLTGMSVSDLERPTFILRDSGDMSYFAYGFFLDDDDPDHPFTARFPVVSGRNPELKVSMPSYTTGRWALCIHPHVPDGAAPESMKDFSECLNFVWLVPGTQNARPKLFDRSDGAKREIAWQGMPEINATIEIFDEAGNQVERHFTSSRESGAVEIRLPSEETYQIHVVYYGKLVRATATLAPRP